MGIYGRLIGRGMEKTEKLETMNIGMLNEVMGKVM